ncbi:MAG: catalase-related domain-containing protein [Paracoccaceae bacterium]
MEPPLRISGDAERYNHRVGNDDYSQPRALHDDVMNDAERARLYRNIAEAMQGIPDAIAERAIGEFTKVAKAYGDGIRAARAALAGAAKAAE